MERLGGRLGIGGCGWHPRDPLEGAAQAPGRVGKAAWGGGSRAGLLRGAVVAPRQPVRGGGLPSCGRGHLGAGGAALVQGGAGGCAPRSRRPGPRASSRGTRPSEPAPGREARSAPPAALAAVPPAPVRGAAGRPRAQRGGRALSLGDLAGRAGRRVPSAPGDAGCPGMKGSRGTPEVGGRAGWARGGSRPGCADAGPLPPTAHIAVQM